VGCVTVLVTARGHEKPGRAVRPYRVFFCARAGNRTRTGDPNLGKVVLYQLSYSRAFTVPNLEETFGVVNGPKGQGTKFLDSL
jgi:hypothetical protein